MGYALKVVINVEDEGVFGNLKDMSIEEAHRKMVDSILWDYLKCRVDYFSYWNEENESFFGKDNPKRMCEIVKHWNWEIKDSVMSSILNIEEKANDMHISVTEWFKKNLDLYAPNTDSHMLDVLRRALNDTFSVWTYGSNKLYIDKYGVDSTLCKKEKILAHPENFAFFDVIYH